MRVRINNIECRFSQSRYEIVKWQPNERYNKQEEHIADGWTLSDGFFRKDNISIQASIFDSPEHCYTIATLHYDAGEGCCDMETVGPRLLDLSIDDRNDFFDVYRLSEERIRKENETNLESE